MAAYTANLAATFTTSTPPVQAVRHVRDFSARLPMCTRYSTTLTTYLNASYPAVLASAVSANNTFGLGTPASRDALDAVLAGDCAGALLPETEVNWLMNVNDTAGALCALVPVGDRVGEEGLPLTFSKDALTDAQLEAVNSQLMDLVRAGEFLLGLQDAYFTKPPRLACAREDAADAGAEDVLKPGGPLQPIDLAGAFMLQGIGLLLGAALHVSKAGRARVRGRVAARLPPWLADAYAMRFGAAGDDDVAVTPVAKGGVRAEQLLEMSAAEDAPEAAAC